MFTPSVSLFSVQWDLRSIWASMDLISKAYFLALLGGTAFMGLSAARILWSIRKSNAERNQNRSTDWQTLSIRLNDRFRLFFLMFLVFGVAVANAVFRGLRAVHYSYSSLREYPSIAALELPTAFSFMSLSIFVCLYCLLWFTETRVRRTRQQKGAF
jgi:hypothetical protein